MPMDRQDGARFNGVEHSLGLIGRRIPQVKVHPEPRRRFGLGGQGIEGMLVNEHGAREIPSLRSERQNELLPEHRLILQYSESR